MTKILLSFIISCSYVLVWIHEVISIFFLQISALIDLYLLSRGFTLTSLHVEALSSPSGDSLEYLTAFKPSSPLSSPHNLPLDTQEPGTKAQIQR